MHKSWKFFSRTFTSTQSHCKDSKMYLLQITLFLLLVTQGKLANEMDEVAEKLKIIEDNTSRTFKSTADLNSFIINVLDATFMTKCSLYQQYVQGNFSKFLISISITKLIQLLCRGYHIGNSMPNHSYFDLFVSLVDMQQISTKMSKDGATAEEKAAVAAENTAKANMMSDGKFKAIFKSAQLFYQAVCNNAELFAGKFSLIKKKIFSHSQ